MISENSLTHVMTLKIYICEATHSNVGWGLIFGFSQCFGVIVSVVIKIKPRLRNLRPFKSFIYDLAIIWVPVSVKSIKWNLIHPHKMRKTRTAVVKMPVAFHIQGLSPISHARHPYYFHP